MPGRDGHNQKRLAQIRPRLEAKKARKQNRKRTNTATSKGLEDDAADSSSESEASGQDEDVDMGGMEIYGGTELGVTNNDVSNGNESGHDPVEEARDDGNGDPAEGSISTETDDKASRKKLTKDAMKVDLNNWGVPLGGVRNVDPIRIKWENAKRDHESKGMKVPTVNAGESLQGP